MNCVVRIFQEYSTNLNLIPSAQTNTQAVAFLPYRVRNFWAHIAVYGVPVISKVALAVQVAQGNSFPNEKYRVIAVAVLIYG
jgi:hypothetical protein